MVADSLRSRPSQAPTLRVDQDADQFGACGMMGGRGTTVCCASRQSGFADSLIHVVPAAIAANGVGQKSKRSAAIEGGLAPGTAAEADAEAPSEAQPVDAADYWTPVQQEPAGECSWQTDSKVFLPAPRVTHLPCVRCSHASRFAVGAVAVVDGQAYMDRSAACRSRTSHMTH